MARAASRARMRLDAAEGDSPTASPTSKFVARPSRSRKRKMARSSSSISEFGPGLAGKSAAVATAVADLCSILLFLTRFVPIMPFYHENCTHWKQLETYDLILDRNQAARRTSALPQRKIPARTGSARTRALPARV